MRAPRGTIATILVILTGCGGPPLASPTGGALPPNGTSPSGEPQTGRPSSAPASPAARASEVDTLVEVAVDDLSVRQEPRLMATRVGLAPSGLRAWVVDGPVEADGHRWFLLTGAPKDPNDQPCGEWREPAYCTSWLGWAPWEWLRPAPPDCPLARDVATYLSLTPEERLFCAGDDEWELKVYLAPEAFGRGCLPVWVTDPGWMTGECNFTFPQPEARQFDEDTRLQMFTPPELDTCAEGGICWQAHKGQWVVVTGHLDHPVAQTCRPVLSGAFEEPVVPRPPTELVVHQCRLHFVVSSLEPAVPPR